ncbi:inorganic pyrophosphatase [Ihubacter sp. rT4E-8]|uniref:inorganic pyrophosphatase n=1 Tax=Ihubacter sp. rT4E-8 TaxID=3242369 RepID=UPI003CF4C283
MKKIKVIVDRPIGYKDEFGNIYPINYGYIEGIMAGDGEEQDAYILGENKPLDCFEGFLIAYVRRRDDNEDKWVVSNFTFSVSEIKEQINFIEQYFDSYIELCESSE